MSLAEWQTQLGQALLWPQSSPASQLATLQGVDVHRLALYEELMFNTVLETLESIYPYTHQCIIQASEHDCAWPALAEAYRRAYPNASHRLMGAVENFPRFLAEQPEWLARYPFLSELALYEWLDMVVLNLPEADAHMPLPQGLPDVSDLGAYAPVWNAARVLQHFEYPIPQVIAALPNDENHENHQNCENFANHENDDDNNQSPAKAVDPLLETQRPVAFSPQPIDILIYRDPRNLAVRFFTLNGLTSLFIQLSMAQPEASYGQVFAQLQDMVPALADMPLESLMAQGIRLLQTCLKNGILLGSTQSQAQ